MSRTARATPRRYVNRSALKAEARAGRRIADRRLLSALLSGHLDPDDAVPWLRSAEVSDRWRHD